MTDAVIGRLSKTLSADAPTFTAWVGMNEAAVAEALAREGFDAVILDMQHGALDFAGASRAIVAVALAGLPAIVRTPVDDFATASRVIDAGAAGVIAPMVNSRADAERFASFAKFPPLGERSWGPGAALSLTGLETQAYLASANGLVQAIAMIETREALAALDDILGVNGIDGVFVGPADLSIALNNGARWDPRGAPVLEAAAQVVARRPGAWQIRRHVLLRWRRRRRDGRARLQTVLGRDRMAPSCAPPPGPSSRRRAASPRPALERTQKRTKYHDA